MLVKRETDEKEQTYIRRYEINRNRQKVRLGLRGTPAAGSVLSHQEEVAFRGEVSKVASFLRNCDKEVATD
jgi:hypothetical protein